MRRMMLTYGMVCWALGTALGWIVHDRYYAGVPDPEIVLPALVVPPPAGACRRANGPYPWVGERGEVRDSSFYGLVCPTGVRLP